ncbi:glutamate receptor ionotropic, kainate 4-like [Amphibalanus amphitrite]|uniref:glutamate receptor ionotropic, kainate 4-like n=1 Tax=Amphibalanus amphitrite TaxID=1232801 RepID=UPI001C90CE57|nr:glutamate receptor ionotropic, kainate 4-like [Amphibalanus amphitrite]
MVRLGDLLSVGERWSGNPLGQTEPGHFPEELVVTAIDDRPHFIINQLANGSYTYDGYLYQLWEILAQQLGLRYRIQPLLNGGGYGYLDPNGTWTGLVGELAAGRADVALSWLTYRVDRAAVVHFVDAVPVERDQYAFSVAGGSETGRGLDSDAVAALLRPLDAAVWWTLLAFLLIVSALLHVVVRYSRPGAETRRTVSEMTWGSCLFLSFMTLVGQGWERTPRSLAARLVTLSSWMLGFLIYCSYTATLTSRLTVSDVSRPISSLREFSEQPGWTFAMEPGLGILNDWRSSDDAVERELYWRAVSGEGFVAINLTTDTVHVTTQSHVMTFIAINRLSFVLGNEACKLVPLLDYVPPKTNTYLAISKRHKKLKKALNKLLLKMNQAGTSVYSRS